MDPREAGCALPGQRPNRPRVFRGLYRATVKVQLFLAVLVRRPRVISASTSSVWEPEESPLLTRQLRRPLARP